MCMYVCIVNASHIPYNRYATSTWGGGCSVEIIFFLTFLLTSFDQKCNIVHLVYIICMAAQRKNWV